MNWLRQKNSKTNKFKQIQGVMHGFQSLCNNFRLFNYTNYFCYHVDCRYCCYRVRRISPRRWSQEKPRQTNPPAAPPRVWASTKISAVRRSSVCTSITNMTSRYSIILQMNTWTWSEAGLSVQLLSHRHQRNIHSVFILCPKKLIVYYCIWIF